MPEVRDRVRELRRVPASELRANPQNWRTHPPEQARALAAMLERIGFAGALLARETPEGLELIDGHLRAELAPDDEVPVLVLDVDADEARLLLATLDPLAAMAETDEAQLARLLDEVAIDQADLEAHVVSFLAKGGKGGTADPDAVPDPPADASRVEAGQVWELGEHRLVCGDSFEPATLDALLGGEPAGMILTDPPFAIYGSSTGVASDVADDKMVRPFFEALFRAAYDRLDWFGHAYIHCDWRSWSAVWEGAKRGGMTPKNCVVWDKGGGGLGANYQNAHEFVGFFAKLPELETMATAKVGHRRQQRPVHRPNIVRVSRPHGDDRQHNAAKPVDLLEELIGNSSDPGDTVLDLFAGSGSTLIAADREGRRARLVEIEPRWCEVTIRRWEAFTGAEAVRADG